jgi:hypothetical protein
MRRRDFLRYGAIGLVTAATGLSTPPARRARAAEIVRCAIHPAIGVARVGNSPDALFLGPEVPGPHSTPEGSFKDAAGLVKRQAARFRVYGLDAEGNVVREITAAEAEIAWAVHLANAKAAWYEFETAFDIPEATGAPSMPGGPPNRPLVTPRRNADLAGAARAPLTIDPGPRAIAGAGINPGGADARYAFDSGRFFDTPVYLGELRTDEAGRLLVLGGRGQSASRVPGTPARTFANNDGWHDDTADGPVTATVRLDDGRALEAEPAWVVVGPPNYAPGIQSVVTLYDVLFEAATKLEPDRTPPRPSFTRQIYPLLARHVQSEWVNAGFLRDFGWGSPGSFLEPSTLARLADPSPASAFIRGEVFRRFRDPAYRQQEYGELPPYYGDAIAFPANSPRQWMAVLPIQYRWLEQWAAGDFDADWPAEGLTFPALLEDLALDEQPAALDRAVLDECLGGAFHPGCEVTWPVRLPLMYAAPFRLRHRTAPEPDWGSEMASSIALAADGPLSASGPGALTRWMAVPWQTDTSSCRSAYEPDLDPYLPTFWPARVPNQVLALRSYQTVMDAAAGMARREAAFRERIEWLRVGTVRGPAAIQLINTFTANWSRYGIITRQPGPLDGGFPHEFWVELGSDV